MRTLELVNHLTDAQLKEQLGAAAGKPEFSRWQILYMIQIAGIHSAAVISPLVNLSRSSIVSLLLAGGRPLERRVRPSAAQLPLYHSALY